MGYDAIGKLETFHEDLRYVAHMAGVDHLLRLDEEPPVRVRESKDKDKARSSSSEKARAFFATLDAGRKERLRQAYQVDFEMFDYSTDGYDMT